MANAWYPALAGQAIKRLSGTVGFPEGGLAYPRPPLTLLTRAGPLPNTVRRLVEHFKLPGAALHQVTHLAPYALPEAAPAASDAAWPVVLVSHGYGLDNAVSESFLTEGLASHGYVVISVSHPGESLATVFPDGHIACLDFDNPRLELETRLGEIEATAGPWGPRAAHSLNVWAEDLRFVLNELERLNGASTATPLGSLAGRLDLAHVGALGVGFGGSAAVALATQDSRITAVACLGGRVAPGSESSAECPSLHVVGEGQDPGAGWSPAHAITLSSARPLHFTGAALWFPLLAQLADFDAGSVFAHYKALNAYSLEFFNRNLRGLEGELRELPSQ
jgi:predicted dienelactone hydrolase